MPKSKQQQLMELDSFLPEDLLNEILLQLPLKSLARFKCVSKQWKTLISSRRFIRTALERYPEPNNTLLTLSGLDGGLIFPKHNGDVNFKQHHLPSKLWLVGAYHGLICFSNNRTGDAYVWNPMTNQRSTIGFDHSRSYKYIMISHFGFGFDAINDYYKVVKASIADGNSYSPMIEICQFKNNEARVKVLPSVEVPFKLCRVSPVTVNGSSHWIAFHPKNKILQIVRFDMNHEKFLEIPFSCDMPKFHYEKFEHPGFEYRGLANEDDQEFSLGVFKGSLCLFVSDPFKWKLEAWSMNCKNHDHSGLVWTKIFEVDRLKYRIEEVFGFTQDNKIVLNTICDGYCFYDPWKEEYVFPEEPYDSPMDEAVAYVESLVSVPSH